VASVAAIMQAMGFRSTKMYLLIISVCEFDSRLVVAVMCTEYNLM